MKALPFDLTEDLAEREAGDLSPGAASAVRSQVRKLRVRLSKRTVNRLNSLLPGGEPRYVRVYDNGGETIDRYTVVFVGKAGGAVRFPYLAMNAAPFHPQGFGQHGESGERACDVDRWGFPPAVGRKNHMGRRVPFSELPPDCQRLGLADYRELWALPS